jgi:hypothetical protein
MPLAEGPRVGSEARVGRAAVRGTVIGFFVVALVASTIGLIAGAGLPGALLIGVFAGGWGGPGWGCMIGATLQTMREENEPIDVGSSSDVDSSSARRRL